MKKNFTFTIIRDRDGYTFETSRRSYGSLYNHRVDLGYKDLNKKDALDYGLAFIDLGKELCKRAR